MACSVTFEAEEELTVLSVELDDAVLAVCAPGAEFSSVVTAFCADVRSLLASAVLTLLKKVEIGSALLDELELLPVVEGWSCSAAARYCLALVASPD